ncbi:ABC transporter permease [Polaromonas sp. JS666]|uniref:ABC transporter permease n=1 Tax=Polaromonas sp. (strain JS666 / ATCC BAA-500) TaxID=296591 RepID=UPI0000464532|nr:ABC transporter permease [Polaromonas sp. JS666]ABE43951.1 binding-protein-dependent transport systems inner membrane component [Polaromonas sp. JS666]
MSTLNSGRLRLALLALPAVVLLLPFLLAVVFVLRFSFSADTQAIDGFSLERYLGLLDPFFLRSVVLTLKLAALSTVICLVLAVPVAMLMAVITQPIWRRVVTSLILLPMILNLLIQSYGWIMVLGPNGIINGVLLKLGLLDRPVQLLFNEIGVLVGLVQTALPLAVFPILGSMRAISAQYLEASASLGAAPWRSFRDITLPLLKPGLIGAASIVFAFNASAFAVPLLLGGRRVQTMGVAIRDMISPMFDWAGAAAAGVTLIAITLATLMAATWLSTRTTQWQGAR